MPVDKIAHSVFLFLVAGLCEISGGWLVWQWLREGKGLSWGLIGGMVLILYGIIPTFQPSISAVFMLPTADFSSFYPLCGAG
jgi:small multidrug resistance family-3 protein